MEPVTPKPGVDAYIAQYRGPDMGIREYYVGSPANDVGSSTASFTELEKK